METLTCRMKAYIQPFERRLAIQELRALTGSAVIPVDGDEDTALTFETAAAANTDVLRHALAYWCSVGRESDGLTSQVCSEATSLIARNGVAVDELPATVSNLIPSNLPNKRCLRYATHGLHEYRGKFFPQLVRALMNVARLPNDAIVLDPMCGSGTTLVEARLAGRKCYGLDMNPLSVFITDVKCEALALEASELPAAYCALRSGLEKGTRRVRSRSRNLSVHDRSYLGRWFDAQTLTELDQVITVIDRLPKAVLRNFYRICLSNILRDVSWQKKDDLRVRREITARTPGDATALFLKEALRSTRTVAAFLSGNGSTIVPKHTVLQADARRAVESLPHLVGSVDAIITSPPYATALPYIDTDRLSLIYLGLLPRDDHRAIDMRMIGNREVTMRCRAEYWAFYQEHKGLLPSATRSLIELIDRLNKKGTVGFRRRNLSALLSTYFFDMRATMKQAFDLLRPGGVMFVVIGNNRTTAGDQPVEIRTADHLAEIAESVEFQVKDRLSMDMLVSRDIFRKNAVPSEQILTLEKPQ